MTFKKQREKRTVVQDIQYGCARSFFSCQTTEVLSSTKATMCERNGTEPSPPLRDPLWRQETTK